MDETLNLFKTITTEYFEELPIKRIGLTVRTKRSGERRIRVVTTTKEWVCSNKGPVITTNYEYL